jgi:hypothetical protein
VIARNVALVEKAQRNPESYTLIESTICSGSAWSIVMTLATGQFWTSDSTGASGHSLQEMDDDDEWVDEDEDENPRLLTQYKDVDEAEIMMAKMVLDRFVKSQGESGFPLRDDEL